jgi:hypothetical protein
MQQDLQESFINQYNSFINQYNSLHLNKNLPRSAIGRDRSRSTAQKGNCMMRTLIRSSSVSRLAGAVAALWLCAGGVASAGDGQNLGTLQQLLSNTQNTGLCDGFLLPPINPCPIPSTITQAVLEIAALGNNLMEMIRAQNAIPPGTSVNAGNAAAVPPVCPKSATTCTPGTDLPMPFPLDAKSNPPLFVPGNATTPASGMLSTLTLLGSASTSQSSGTAQPVQLFDITADTYLSAVGVSSMGLVGSSGLTDPDMVYFFYDDTLRNNQTFVKGQIVAKFLYQMTVSGSGTETTSPVELEIVATANCNSESTCLKALQAYIVSGFGASTSAPIAASQFGINSAVVFSPSPALAQNHAILEVAVPLALPPSTDPAYFYTANTGFANPINFGVDTAFLLPTSGLPTTGSPCPTLNPASQPSCPIGSFVGLAPSAGPLTQPSPPNYALCADLPDNGSGQNNQGNNGSTLRLRHAVAAYYAMATSGEMLLSAPLPSAFTTPFGGTPPVCPPL